MNRSRVIITVLFLVMCLMHFQAHAENVLINSGFEGGDFPFEGWVDWSGSESNVPEDGVAGFPVPTELAHQDAKAMGKILYGTGDRWGGISQEVEIRGPGMFRASGWIMSQAGDDGLKGGAKAYIEVKCVDGYDAELKKVKSSSVSRPTMWNKVTLRGIIPEETQKIIYSFVVTGNTRSSGKVLFDDAVLDIQR